MTAGTPFTMQSVSKPFVYALALSVLGLDEVCRWVSAEPSGEAYNAISLEPDTGRPDNAMVNAGAIITTALIPDTPDAPRFERILDCLSRFSRGSWTWTSRCTPPRPPPATATAPSPI